MKGNFFTLSAPKDADHGGCCHDRFLQQLCSERQSVRSQSRLSTLVTLGPTSMRSPPASESDICLLFLLLLLLLLLLSFFFLVAD
jgi:hypothetical protein